MKDTVSCYCPSCQRQTPHVVFHERLLAAVQWCQRCYQITIRPDDAPDQTVQPQPQAAAA